MSSSDSSPQQKEDFASPGFDTVLEAFRDMQHRHVLANLTAALPPAANSQQLPSVHTLHASRVASGPLAAPMNLVDQLQAGNMFPNQRSQLVARLIEQAQTNSGAGLLSQASLPVSGVDHHKKFAQLVSLQPSPSGLPTAVVAALLQPRQQQSEQLQRLLQLQQVQQLQAAASTPLRSTVPLVKKHKAPTALPMQAAKKPKTNKSTTTRAAASLESTSECLTTSRRGGRTEQFPMKLYRLLSDVEGTPDAKIVSWTLHGTAFAVHDLNAFVTRVLPKYFAHKNFLSFRRQLNNYAFERLERSRQARGPTYAHPHFRHGQEKLLPQVQRVEKLVDPLPSAPLLAFHFSS